MPNSRRQFLRALSGGLAAGSTWVQTTMARETDGMRAKRATDALRQEMSSEGKLAGVSKDDLPTPALLVDLDRFEANVQRMAEHARESRLGLRPHAKTHKCVHIARRQLAAGALGISVATVPEAEWMVAGGVRGVLLTSPIATPGKIQRMAQLAHHDPEIMVAVDNPALIDGYQEAAARENVTLHVLIDVNVGDRRTGTAPGESALRLAQQVTRSQNLRLRGLQAYSGSSSHVVGFPARRQHSHRAMSLAIQTRQLLVQHGLTAEILSGGSTGTYNIDSDLDGVTELQVGSYVFMDVDYRRIGGRGGEQYDDFAPSLSVLATVVSANHADQVTVDAGLKAFATDRPFGPEPKDVAGVTYRFGGDEFGILTLEGPNRPIQWGDRLEFIVPHCDPTVNLYDRLFACRGNQVEEVWSIMNRLPARGE